jgi:hypothetical protein
MQRMLEPELLDSLPPDHPDALHNRRDLRLTNLIVGNHRWLLRRLPKLMRAGETALELGAGDGALGLQFAKRGVPVDGLDVWPRPRNWRSERAWHVADLRAFDGYHDYAVVFGNLIFHQFSEPDLAALGAKLRKATRAIVACEPQRRRLSQVLYRTLGPVFGANHVSLHDAHVSIAAGFRGDELPQALGLVGSGWSVQVSTTALGLYRMIAARCTS